jgi:hypothetical protein
MSSGFRELKFNTQERLISPDINRAQKFVGADVAELFRYMMNVSAQDDLEAGASVAEHASIEAPLRAEIVNGFLARPQLASTRILVDAGVAFFLAPDGAADESGYKYVHFDPATQPGVLIMTANATGSIRIDVIEMSFGSPQVVSDSRDVFNPSTGLFTASLLTKESRAGVVLRIRTGTPGGGYPGPASGWCPIAIMSVPAGATDCDAVTFWDVRPLVSDRTSQPFALSSEVPDAPVTYGKIDVTTGPVATLSGYTRACSPEGRRLGGRLRRGSPGTDGQSILLTDTANRESGLVFSGSYTMMYLYLLTPFGLPRWARYTDAASGARVPRSPRGIPILSAVAPNGITSAPSAPITFPAVFGFGGSTQSGICIGTTENYQINELAQNCVQPTYFDGRRAHVGTAQTSPALPQLNTTTIDVHTQRATLVPGTHFPANAKRVLLAMNGQLSTAAQYGSQHFLRVRIWNGSPASGLAAAQQVAFTVPGPTVNTQGYLVYLGAIWIPVPISYPNAAVSFDVDLWDGGGNFNGTSQFYVHGWEV